MSTEAQAGTIPAPVEQYDVVIIGAGVTGLYQLYRVRELGLSVRVYDDASGVGGTWYWNRYPGCRFDSESETYGYSWSKELLQKWDWKEHFSAQPDNERYLNYTGAISHVHANGLERIEPTAEAEEAWVQHAAELSSQTLLSDPKSWFMGSNIPGKARALLLYTNSAVAYREKCEEVAANGYQGFLLQ